MPFSTTRVMHLKTGTEQDYPMSLATALITAYQRARGNTDISTYPSAKSTRFVFGAATLGLGDFCARIHVLDPGDRFQHFRTGAVIEILCVAEDTEHARELMVVYHHPDSHGRPRIWARPYAMFFEDVEGKMRFAPVPKERQL